MIRNPKPMFCELSDTVFVEVADRRPRPLRIVTVWTTAHPDAEYTSQQLLLPEDDALELMAGFGSLDYKVKLMEASVKDNGWTHRRALFAGTALIARLSDLLTAWLGADAKYLNLRIDLRGGDFNITNTSGQEFSAGLLDLVRNKLRVF